MALTVCAFILAAEGGHVVRAGVGQQQSDVDGGAPLHCGGGQETVKNASAHTSGLTLRQHAASQEQVRRFQQHSRSLPAVPTRYLEQPRRPKHRFLSGEERKGPFV